MDERGHIYWPGVALVTLSVLAIVMIVGAHELGVFETVPAAELDVRTGPAPLHVIPVAAVLAVLIAPLMSIVARQDGESE